MRVKNRSVFIIAVFSLAVSVLLVSSVSAKRSKIHPFDVYNHEMHNGLFEAAGVSCDKCHADPASYGDRKKVNPMGCHGCHKDPNPPIPATRTCTMCHFDGIPKPMDHKVNWMEKHQVYGKNNPPSCNECHPNQMFCLDCHTKRQTVRERVHRRNFRFTHSVKARANPRSCDSCHTVNYCQECHSGRGSSKR